MSEKELPSLSEYNPHDLPWTSQAIKDVFVNYDYSKGIHEILCSGTVGCLKEDALVWTDEAQEVHGITRSKAMRFKPQEEVLCDYIEFLSSYKSRFTMVCHAMPFLSSIDLIDRNFIFYWFDYLDRRFDYYRLFNDEGTLTTIDRKRTQATQRYGIENQKLDTWIDKLGLEKRDKHSALEDARICAEIFRYQQRFEGLIHDKNRTYGYANAKTKNDKGRFLEEEILCC